MMKQIEVDGGLVIPPLNYDRADSIKMVETLVAILGTQPAVAAMLNASQSQVNGWVKGEATMTPGYMGLARRMLLESDRRELFIRQFYADRLLVMGDSDEILQNRNLVQEIAGVDKGVRRVTRRVETEAPALVADLVGLACSIATAYFRWSFHVAGDFYGFYLPSHTKPGAITTSVFFVDCEDNRTGRANVDPVFGIEVAE